MQHIPATIEEQLVLKAVREECPWEGLPKRLQSTVATKEEWHRRIIEHCIRKRLQWNACFARKVIKESEYYEEMMRYLRKNLALFPYHLAEYICRVMRISPFRYYCDMIFEVMKNEQPYDSLPNFTAADALRLTGIGRNEFIDIMNKCRSKKFMWKINKSIAKELLPTQPVNFHIEPWWAVCLVNFTLEEFKKLSDEEMATIDKVCKEELNSFIHFDPEIIKGLYQRGLVYFDVPVYTDDRFKVSRLEGFVSNREQMYEDPIEELLYAVFVVASENSTVAELAATLQADLLQLQAAASFACRLGWANKLIDPASVLQESSTHASIGVTLSDEEDGSVASMGSANLSTDGSHLELSGMEHSRSASSQARVAFIVDANITSYLMMGSVSPGLKSHAVTLYEAGKLGHASIADLCKDLRTLEGAKFEGELQEFANHACSLCCVLECLLSGGVSDNDKEVEGLGKVDASVIQTDEASSRSCLSGNSGNLDTNERDHIGNEELSGDLNASESDVPMLPGSNLSGNSGNLDTNGRDHSGDEELPGDLNTHQDASESNVPILPASPQDDLAHLEGADRHGGDEASSAISSSNTHNQGEESTLASSLQIDGNGRKKRNYRVDMLRCESLASLAPATLERLFNRDYDIVLSMIPLPQSSILPGPTGPIHFGPPSHSSMTPWMKLVLYATVSNGPLSVILMKGQCLRLVPAPLAGCEKALIWSWDGSTTGGLGGKFEGNLVKGSVLLHCLNSLLKHSAVLVQPLNKADLDRSGKIITLDIPLPLKNSDGSVVEVGPEYGLGMVESSKLNSLLRDLAHKLDLWTIGYIRLIRLLIENDADQFLPEDEKYEWVPLSVEFGVPLFSPKLCNDICKRVISSQLLQTESFSEHHEAMHNLRRQLRDVCSDYHATGPTAKLLYNKEKSKSSRQLMTYASGRWNPLLDPSSPLSGAKGDYQRKKLAMRQRSRREVLSFDGSILRSYALTPVYEPATRPIDESVPLVTPKVESDETDSKEVVLPGVNLLFDGSELSAFEIGACLQARQPVCLIAEASSASTAFGVL